jgi:hypothetical protein
LEYYKYEKAPQAPPEEVEGLEFPNSYEKGSHLDGPSMAALQVAMNEFMPPGKKVTTTDGNERLEQCLSRWETFDASVLKVNEGLYFVRFSPRLSRCGIEEFVLDAGAEYAVDGTGRILDVH